MKLRDVYEEIADSWNNLRNKPVSYLPFEKIRGSTIDIGCGNARNLIPIAKSGNYCVGIDFSKNMIKNALKLCEKNNVEIEFVIADAANLPIKSKSFDNCISIATIHHLQKEQRQKSLREMKRVAKKHVFISVWYRWQFYHLKNLLKNIFHFGDVYVDWHKGDKVLKRYYHLYSKKELENYVLSAGLKIQECKIVEENKKKNVFVTCKVK